MAQVVEPPALAGGGPAQRAQHRRPVELRAAGGGDEEVVGILALCQLLDDREDAVGDWHPAGAPALGRLGADALGCGAADQQPRGRHLDQVVHPQGAGLGPAQSGPPEEEQDVGEAGSSCCHLRWAASSASSVHGRISTCSSEDRGTGTPVTGFVPMRVLQRASGIRIWPDPRTPSGTFRHRPTLMSHCDRVRSPRRAHHCLVFRYQALRGRQSGATIGSPTLRRAHGWSQRVRRSRSPSGPHGGPTGGPRRRGPNPHIRHDASVGAHRTTSPAAAAGPQSRPRLGARPSAALPAHRRWRADAVAVTALRRGTQGSLHTRVSDPAARPWTRRPQVARGRPRNW